MCGTPSWNVPVSSSRLTLLFRILPVVVAIPMLVGVAWLWSRADDGGARASLPAAAYTPAAVPPDDEEIGDSGEALVALPALPEPTPKTREEKRFARADRDDDGRVSQAEFLSTRRRNFDKLDVNGDGRLSFEEYAAEGIRKFTTADQNRDGVLGPAEFATTAKPPTSRTAARKDSPAACACS
mgnify:CR=1 FL=1